MNKVLTVSTTVKRLPLIVELAGPAGAGKTTLAKALKQRSERILTCAPPYFRTIGHIPFFARNIILSMPTFFHLYQNNNGRWFTPREIAWLVTLKGWHRVLARQVSGNDKVIVLDQGPVFMLAWLYGFGPERLKSHIAKTWWDTMYKQWADALNIVIWLDTSDMTLVERIRARDVWHGVKEKSNSDACEFLARWRAANEQVLSALTAEAKGPKVFRFDTAQKCLDETVNRVLVLFDFTDYEDKVVS
jgi:broad-specificity NMP kinase